MPTDQSVARDREACPDDRKSQLVDQVHQRTRTVIDAELLRLARRVPSLRRADLDIVDAALAELAESLIMARLRSAGQDEVPLLERIFVTTKVVA